MLIDCIQNLLNSVWQNHSRNVKAKLISCVTRQRNNLFNNGQVNNSSKGQCTESLSKTLERKFFFKDSLSKYMTKIDKKKSHNKSSSNSRERLCKLCHNSQIGDEFHYMYYST